MTTKPKYVCQKCGKKMAEGKFFTYRDGTKCELCKPCLTMHIDNFDPETFTWILKKFDYPYIPSKWNDILDEEYRKKNGMIDGLSVLGKYFSAMRLAQWKDYRWADTEKLIQEYDDNIAKDKVHRDQERKKAQELFEKGEISEAEYRTYTSTMDQRDKDEKDRINAIIQAAVKSEDRMLAEARNSSFAAKRPTPAPEKPTKPAPPPNPMIKNYYDETKFVPKTEIPDLTEQLTTEDKQAMLLKWGREYTANEWIALEKHYSDMTESFDIQDADSDATLILICKTYLKMTQSLDAGDYDSYTKLSKVYNDMRRSAKFTASQLKEQKQGEFDSIGQLVAWCEKHGGEIPKFEIEAPLDVVDVILTDMKSYVKNLFTQDTTMGNALDTYLQKKMAGDNIVKERTDKDYEDYAQQRIEMGDEDDLYMEADF